MIELLGVDATPENLEYAIYDIKERDLGEDGERMGQNAIMTLEEKIDEVRSRC